MKYIILSAVALFATIICSNAQDLIFKKNGDEIKGKVVEITNTEVKYRKFENPTGGPIYSFNLSEIFLIRYENGTKDVFGETTSPSKKAETEPLPEIPSGTIIRIIISADISSKEAEEGSLVSFTTAEPLFIKGILVAPGGSPVSGTVKDVVERKGLGKAGQLSLSVDFLTLPDGKKVRLSSQSSISAKGQKKTGAAVATAAVTTVLVAPLGALFLLKKGKDAKIERGTIFSVYVE